MGSCLHQNEKLNVSLNAYLRLALDLGISDAKIIKASDVLIDERVRLKCSYPRCANYGALCGILWPDKIRCVPRS